MGLVFVHGITVRRDRFDRLLGDVRDGLATAGSELAVTGCYWGDLGRSPRYSGASIPGFLDGRRGLDDRQPIREVAGSAMAMEALLLEDPLAELVGLRDPGGTFALEPVGFDPVPQDVAKRNAALAAGVEQITAEIAAASARFTGPDAQLSTWQIAEVVRTVFAEAARADRALDVLALHDPLTRAVTAGLYQSAVRDGDDLSSEFRWSVAQAVTSAAIEDALGGQRGFVGDLAANALTQALRLGLRNRIMKGMSLFVGDVLAWFQNREAILDRLDEAVQPAAADGPLVLVGHSLGGIIAFEYCVRANREVRLLATVGSQVGLFGELGVLAGRDDTAPGKSSPPESLGAWRNLWDPDDALSFLAAPIFTDVSDIEVDTRAPFPASHSEYWNRPDVYDKLVAAGA
jgi:hypothetical protein